MQGWYRTGTLTTLSCLPFTNNCAAENAKRASHNASVAASQQALAQAPRLQHACLASRATSQAVASPMQAGIHLPKHKRRSSPKRMSGIALSTHLCLRAPHPTQHAHARMPAMSAPLAPGAGRVGQRTSRAAPRATQSADELGPHPVRRLQAQQRATHAARGLHGHTVCTARTYNQAQTLGCTLCAFASGATRQRAKRAVQGCRATLRSGVQLRA